MQSVDDCPVSVRHAVKSLCEILTYRIWNVRLRTIRDVATHSLSKNIAMLSL